MRQAAKKGLTRSERYIGDPKTVSSIRTIPIDAGLSDVVFDYDIFNRNFEIASVLGLGFYVRFYFIWFRVLDDFIYPALSESDEG